METGLIFRCNRWDLSQVQSSLCHKGIALWEKIKQTFSHCSFHHFASEDDKRNPTHTHKIKKLLFFCPSLKFQLETTDQTASLAGNHVTLKPCYFKKPNQKQTEIKQTIMKTR